jgi:Major Facilitator Superfamily.
MNKYGLTKKKWLSIGAFATLGSVAWCIENQFLNLFIDRTITTNPYGITLIVAASAIVATLTTLLVGVRLDKEGRRAPYMKYGYMVWGVSIMLFAVIKVEYFEALGLKRDGAIIAAVAAVAVWDCVMTFFGSTANDAAFNAWVTDNTTVYNRSKSEGAIGLFGAIGTGIVFGLDLFGKITYNTYYDAQGNVVTNYVEGGSVKTGNWTLFFCLLGGLVLLVGLLGRFFLKDSPDLKPNPDSSYKKIFYGFRPDVVKENKKFYVTLIAVALSGVASQVSGPYSLIYIQRTLGFADYAIPFAAIGFVTVVFALIFGFVIDKKGGKSRFLIPGLIVLLIGNVICYFAEKLGNIAIIIYSVGSAINGFGGAMVGNVIATKIRDYTPKERVGLFQGVRMCFSVLIPMCLGPVITAIMTTLNEKNVIGLDENGAKIYNYSSDMFLLSGAAMLLTLIPYIFLMKYEKEENKA